MTLIVAIYVPLAFVTSYFGMNTKAFTEGGYIPVKQFWQISVPLVVATIGLPLIATIIARTTASVTATANSYSRRQWPFLLNLTLFVFYIAYLYAKAARLSKQKRGVSWEIFYFQVSAAEPIIVNSIIAILTLLKTIELSIRRKKSARREFFMWLGLTVTSVFCAALSRFDRQRVHLTLLIPLCYFVIMLLGLLFLGIFQKIKARAS